MGEEKVKERSKKRISLPAPGSHYTDHLPFVSNEKQAKKRNSFLWLNHLPCHLDAMLSAWLFFPG